MQFYWISVFCSEYFVWICRISCQINLIKSFESYLEYILDLYCVWLSSANLFWENYAKPYFDAIHLEKGLERGGERRTFSKRCLFSEENACFHKKSVLSGQYRSCTKFLEYALLVLSISCSKFIFKINFWNISLNLLMKLVENPQVTQPNQSQVIKVNLLKVSQFYLKLSWKF